MLCYFEKFKFNKGIDNMLFTDLLNGWPALQIRLLNELIYTARRLGDPSLAVRYDLHVLLLLQGLI